MQGGGQLCIGLCPAAAGVMRGRGDLKDLAWPVANGLPSRLEDSGGGGNGDGRRGVEVDILSIPPRGGRHQQHRARR